MQTIDRQANTYLFDLRNEAKEHGFKGDDTWTVSLVSDAERKRIEKEFYPAVATKVSEEGMLQMFQSVKSALGQPLNKEEQLLDGNSIVQSELKNIIAFNFKRTR